MVKCIVLSHLYPFIVLSTINHRIQPLKRHLNANGGPILSWSYVLTHSPAPRPKKNRAAGGSYPSSAWPPRERGKTLEDPEDVVPVAVFFQILLLTMAMAHKKFGKFVEQKC